MKHFSLITRAFDSGTAVGPSEEAEFTTQSKTTISSPEPAPPSSGKKSKRKTETLEETERVKDSEEFETPKKKVKKQKGKKHKTPQEPVVEAEEEDGEQREGSDSEQDENEEETNRRDPKCRFVIFYKTHTTTER